MSYSGNLVLIEIDNVVIAGQKDASINMNTSTVDTTTKTTATGWASNTAEMNDWSIDCGGLIDLEDEGYKKLKDAWRNKRHVTVKYGTADAWEEGEAVITSISESAPMNDRCTYSASFTGTGELVPKTKEPAGEEGEGPTKAKKK